MKAKLKIVSLLMVSVFVMLGFMLLLAGSASALSKANGKIAFSRCFYSGSFSCYYHEIYSIYGDGSSQTPLADTYDTQSAQAWSPDGSKIAYMGGDYGLWVMNADGSGLTEINPWGGNSPSWSPDGSKIAYSSSDIFVVNADGSNQTRVTNNPTGAGAYGPSWSPDGTKIAFASDRDNPGGGNSQIYVMNADGSNQTRVTNNPTGAGAYGPSWSPDGTKITFVNFDTWASHGMPAPPGTDSGFAQIYIML